jgi:hypothetical protein
VKAQPLHQLFQDGSSTVSKRYRITQGQSKREMDASMIRLSQESALVAILRTKKNKYRVSTSQVMLCFKGGELRNFN